MTPLCGGGRPQELNTLAHYKVGPGPCPPRATLPDLCLLTAASLPIRSPEGASLAMSLTDKKDNTPGPR